MRSRAFSLKVGEVDAVERVEDEFFYVVGIERWQGDGVGDAAEQVFVDAELEFVHENRLCDEYEVVTFGKVFK